MGLIRKTLSVGTLGTVSFRSKKEKLLRAERSQLIAESSLAGEHAARVLAEDRSSAAEKRAKRASIKAERTAKHLEQTKRRRRRHRKSDLKREVLASLEPMLHSGVESAKSAGSDAAEISRESGRRARKTAKRSVRHAKAVASSAKVAAAPHAASVMARAGEAIDHLTAPDS